MRYLTALAMSLICQFGYAQETPPILDRALPDIQSANPTLNRELKKEILSMVLEDQTARLQIVDNRDISEEEREKLSKIEAKHNLRLKEIIYAYGWPGNHLVGLTGSRNFWLLVQHQDNDLEFQKQCLQLLEEAVHKQDAQLQNYAYLLDRVRKNENLPQIYGTQWDLKDGQFFLCPVEAPEGLNDRRKEVGLGYIEESLEQMKQHYFKKN